MGSSFKTARGYGEKICEYTYSLEDYLEMIYRYCVNKPYIRVKTLASC